MHAYNPYKNRSNADVNVVRWIRHLEKFKYKEKNIFPEMYLTSSETRFDLFRAKFIILYLGSVEIEYKLKSVLEMFTFGKFKF